jgi:excisionase family DNA binding protein
MPGTGDDSMKNLASRLRALAAEMLQVADAMDKERASDGPMKVPEVAKRLGLSRSTVQRWARLGRIGRKVGRDYLIDPQELAAYRAGLKAAGKAGR